MKKTSQHIGKFGPIYTQFKNKPKNAIKHLKKVKNGECLNALYREEIGFVDIVWGKNDENNRGYGLKHIIEKHEKEFKKFQKSDVKIEDLIPFIFEFGTIKEEREQFKIIINNERYRIVLLTKWYGRKKALLLTSYVFKEKKSKVKKL
ncbi:MAG: hypothetical protein LBH22_06310 [Bacteroidales bacterium]|jgi:uncharacterized radical SAM superfamily protein|nr:hypothetical protein [Bacteroidales bacterium]